jgi:hypothetical protein
MSDGAGHDAGRPAVAVVAVLALASSRPGRAGRKPSPTRRTWGCSRSASAATRACPDGDRPPSTRTRQLCAGCHDGVELDRWSGARRRTGGRSRSGSRTRATCGHAAASSRWPARRATCRRAPVRMRCQGSWCWSVLLLPRPPRRGPLVDALRTCHAPPRRPRWAAPGWPPALPGRPRTGDFLRRSTASWPGAEPARCATCHTQERCTSCHVNADHGARDRPDPGGAAVAGAAALRRPLLHPAEPRGAGLPRGPRRIASVQAAPPATPRTTAPPATPWSCRRWPASCLGQDVRAPGVLLEPKLPPSHTWPSFIERARRAGRGRARLVHVVPYAHECSDCHEASVGTGRCPRRWRGPCSTRPTTMARHSAEAYGRQLECSSCHDTAAFCRDCHEQAGFETVGRLGRGLPRRRAELAAPPRPAGAQALESCATCHKQTDCLQCHSTLGAFKVSPHGAASTPGARRRRNPAICFACHRRDTPPSPRRTTPPPTEPARVRGRRPRTRPTSTVRIQNTGRVSAPAWAPVADLPADACAGGRPPAPRSPAYSR